MALNVKNADVVISPLGDDQDTIIFSTDVSSQATILKASIVNHDAYGHTVSVYRVANNSNSSNSNMIINGAIIGGGQTLVLPLNGQVLIEGQSLRASCNAANVVNFNISLSVKS